MDEIYAAIHNDERVSKQYNIDKNRLVMAEPAKTQAFGFNADEVLSAAREIGYSDVDARYHWYLAQARVMHQQSFDAADCIDEHLRRLSPLTDHLYKYLEFTFVK
jgi:S-adenosylmethionine synthetase